MRMRVTGYAAPRSYRNAKWACPADDVDAEVGGLPSVQFDTQAATLEIVTRKETDYYEVNQGHLVH